MKYLRLIIFIPATIVVLILSNALYDFLINLISYFYSNSDLNPFSFIWESFIKSVVVTFISVSTGLTLYPFEKKLPAIIALTLLFIFLYLIIFFLYAQLSQIIDISIVSKKIILKGLISQISMVLGSLIAIRYVWKEF